MNLGLLSVPGLPFNPTLPSSSFQTKSDQQFNVLLVGNKLFIINDLGNFGCCFESFK